MQDRELRWWYEELNRRHFGGRLAVALWEVRFAPELRHRAGDCDFRRRRIRVADYLRRHYGRAEVLNTLLHEMVHQWQFERTGRSGHGGEFWARLRAIPDYTADGKHAPPNPEYERRRAARLLVYQCPACGQQVYRRRRGTWSCARCDSRWNPRYRLVLAAVLEPPADGGRR